MNEIVAMFEPYLIRRGYPAGKILWFQGDTDNGLTIIEKGRIKIIRTRQDGSTILFYVFGPGEIFGFSPLFEGVGYPATAEAIDNVEVMFLPKAAFYQIVDNNPKIVRSLFALLGKRLRESFDRIENLSNQNVTGRVAAYIETLLTGSLTAQEQPVLMIPRPLYISAQEIGVTPETFSRILTRLEKTGIIKRIDRGKIQILNSAELV